MSATAARVETRWPLDAAFKIRTTIVAVAGLAALAGCLGLTSQIAFSQPSTLKYVLTIAGPVGVALLAGYRDPLRVLVALTIIAAPFDVVVTLQGLTVSPAPLLGAVACVLMIFEPREHSSRSAMALAVPLWIALLAPAVARATSPMHYILLLGTILTAGLLARRQASEPGGLAFLLGSIVAAAALQAAIAIWEFKTHHVLNFYGSGQSTFSNTYFFGFDGTDRPSAAFFDPISLGNVLAVALPLALALFLRTSTIGRKVLLLAAMPLIGLGLALTLSRTSWIAGAVGVVVVVCFLPARRLHAAFAVAVTTGVSLTVALTLGGHALQQRFSSLSDPTGRGVSTAAGDKTRENIWSGAWKVASRHETLGVGFGHLNGELSRLVAAVAPGTHAHSTYLELLAEAGAVGAAGLLIVVLAATRDIWCGRSLSPTLATGLLGSLAALLVCWSTDYTLRYLQVAVFVAVIFGAASGIGSRRPT